MEDAMNLINLYSMALGVTMIKKNEKHLLWKQVIL